MTDLKGQLMDEQEQLALQKDADELRAYQLSQAQIVTNTKKEKAELLTATRVRSLNFRIFETDPAHSGSN